MASTHIKNEEYHCLVLLILPYAHLATRTLGRSNIFVLISATYKKIMTQMTWQNKKLGSSPYRPPSGNGHQLASCHLFTKCPNFIAASSSRYGSFLTPVR